MQTGSIQKSSSKVKPNAEFLANLEYEFRIFRYSVWIWLTAGQHESYFSLPARRRSQHSRFLAGGAGNRPIVQPIIGSLSDRTWSPALGPTETLTSSSVPLLGSIAMILMPNSTSLWMAAGLMWMLDAGLNVSMEPFRAFIGDKLNDKQRDLGFAVQSFMVGFGQTLANLMPRILPLFGITMVAAGANGIPDSVNYAFYIGAVAVLASVLWTMCTTKEYPPEDLAAFERGKTRRVRDMYGGVR